MAREIDKYRNEKYKGKNFHLFNQWDLLDKRYGNDDRIAAIVVKKQNAQSKLPEKYEIIFNIKSIVGVKPKNEKGLEEPVFGNKHKMTIELPENYPSAGGGFPVFKFITDVWHPNIRFFGDFKGRVCLNFQDYPPTEPLTTFVDRIIGYLPYDDYFAEDRYPWPEDVIVAEWVREQAEPNKWLNFIQD
jgi:ubiquitin-protein ligase